MSSKEIWNKEYGEQSQLLSRSKEPQAFIGRLFKFLRKRGFDFSEAAILDLGCGNGRNLIYFSTHGAKGLGVDISGEAIKQAKLSAVGLSSLDFRVASIAEDLDYPNNSFDLVIDATASNALNEIERVKYLKIVTRLLKPGGYFFVRALCLEGDKNAKNLIKNFPGKEHDTYIMPGIGLVERVFSRADFLKTYKDFEILELKKESGYSRIGKEKYRRNFWLAIMQLN